MNQTIEVSQKTNLNRTPSSFYVDETNKTLKLTTDALGCDNNLVCQEKDSVLNTIRSWIANVKLIARDVQKRQCKGLLGYASQFEKLFIDKETPLVCRKHSSKQFGLP